MQMIPGVIALFDSWYHFNVSVKVHFRAVHTHVDELLIAWFIGKVIEEVVEFGDVVMFDCMFEYCWHCFDLIKKLVIFFGFGGLR